MRHYFAVLEPAASGALHISFPDWTALGRSRSVPPTSYNRHPMRWKAH